MSTPGLTISALVTYETLVWTRLWYVVSIYYTMANGDMIEQS